jgi:hypothetical protein
LGAVFASSIRSLRLPPKTQRSYPLEFFRFSGNTSKVPTKIEGVAYQGLSVSPDQKSILVSRSVSSGADLMMIENFR